MPNWNPKHQSQSNRFADDIPNHCKVVRPVIDSLSSRVLLLYLPEIIANYRHHAFMPEMIFHRKIFYFFKTALSRKWIWSELMFLNKYVIYYNLLPTWQAIQYYIISNDK